MKEEQPKDFEVVTFDDFRSNLLKDLNFFQKIMFYAGTHPLVSMLLTAILGYGAGAYFGKFW